MRRFELLSPLEPTRTAPWLRGAVVVVRAALIASTVLVTLAHVVRAQSVGASGGVGITTTGGASADAGVAVKPAAPSAAARAPVVPAPAPAVPAPAAAAPAPAPLPITPTAVPAAPPAAPARAPAIVPASPSVSGSASAAGTVSPAKPAPAPLKPPTVTTPKPASPAKPVAAKPVAAKPVAAKPVAAKPTAPAAVAAKPASTLPWDLTNRAFNGWDGSSGGMFVDDPGMAEVGSLRLQLAIDSYSGDGFLYDGDSVEQDRQQLSLSWTALRILEVFASLLDRASSSDTPAHNSLHAFGDVTVGMKVGTTIGKFARVSGSLRLLALGDVGEHGSLLDATSMGARASGALDLQRLDDPLPLVIRLNLDYLLDNSGKALDDIEALRYDALADAAPASDETRHLITRVERFGLAVNRVDVLTVGLGVEVPLALTDDLFLYPMAEFRIGMPINRQDFNCAFRSSDKTRGTNAAAADDTCLDDAGLDGWPMNATIGVRVAPPIRGVSLLLGIDLAITGADTFVRELAPQVPYRVLFALGYDYDARPPAVPRAAPAPPPLPAAPVVGHVAGKVVDQMTNAPISGVVVSAAGRSRGPVATDAMGRFTSYELSPGEVVFDLSHPDYQSASCAATVPGTGGEVEASCSLVALPASGALKLTVRDQFGAAVAGAHVLAVGVSTQSGATDASGEVLLEGLGEGEYTARIESDAYLMRVVRLSIARRQQTTLEASLSTRPPKSGLQRKGQEIKLSALKFQGDSVELGPGAALAVAELADLLLRDPTIRRVRIQADGGLSLALGRALAIKQRLVDAGVPDARLEAATEPAPKPAITIVE